jgi:DNA polymerase-3 subunit delta'
MTVAADRLGEALADQPQARIALEAALRDEEALSHAYLFHGLPGTGKRAAARAFAAALIAEGAPDPADAERRVLSGVHPDIEWVEPRGAHDILVDDVRDQVVRQAALSPFEASRRVFVIAEAERMNEESQNALLKTLEEPAAGAVYVLTSSAPGRLLETIPSRCRMVRFAPVPPARIAEQLETEGVASDTAIACARLAGGNVERARFLAGPGAEQRAEAEHSAGLVLEGLDDAHWVQAGAARPLLARAATAGSAAEEAVLQEAERLLEDEPARGRKGRGKEWETQARRAKRRAQTASLDLSLELVQLWFRDLVAVSSGADAQAFNADRLAELRKQAEDREASIFIDCVELVEDTRRRLERNVLEDLAVTALFDSLRRVASGRRG